MRVVDKRDLQDLNAVRRRRKCLDCGHRFTTYERIELAGIAVVKKDGRREAYDRRKLMGGLLRACEKRPVSSAALDALVMQVEGAIRSQEEREVPSRLIGELVMERLRDLDKVAYIRFASVYREFKDLDSFENELEQFRKTED